MNYEQSGVPKNAGTDSNEGFTLDATFDLLRLLGDPQNSLKAVHIAGSKGKGSVATFVSSILHESGFRTGLYTSPHMHSIRERLQILGSPGAIPESDYRKLIQDAAPAIAEVRKRRPLTHFEALTALSFKYFADQGCDAVVVETGLGGARDATNVLPPSAVQAAVITSIGMEHVEALGGSLRSIAEAKAGIAKPGRPLILGRQPEPEALQVLRHVAASRGAQPILYAPEHVTVDSLGTTQNESSWPSVLSERIRISAAASSSSSAPIETSTYLLGPHQHDNIATAVTAVRQLQRSGGLGRPISEAQIERGIARAALPGRFQVLRRRGEGDQLVVLDGAHTEASARALVESLRAYLPGRKVALIVACAADKDHVGIMRELRKLRPNVAIFASTAIAGATQRSAGTGQLVAAWQQAIGAEGRPTLRCRELLAASVFSAVERAGRELSAYPGEPGVVVVTGSLHAVAEAMKVDL